MIARCATGATPDATLRCRPTPVHLEPPDVFFVMFRVESGQVVRIRSFSIDCPLDGGGRNVHWFTNVAPADSLAFLQTFVASSQAPRLADSAVAAIAMHDGTQALDALIALAREHARSKVRGNALFWLAQRAGEKAVGTISAAINDDPDTEVKKKAVFALSQLPPNEGVPLLIQQAKTNKNAAVRKQAMFWLGQSRTRAPSRSSKRFSGSFKRTSCLDRVASCLREEIHVCPGVLCAPTARCGVRGDPGSGISGPAGAGCGGGRRRSRAPGR